MPAGSDSTRNRDSNRCEMSDKFLWILTSLTAISINMNSTMFPSFLTSVLFGELESNEKKRSEPVTVKSTDRGSVNAGGIESYAFSGMQGWRTSMEDAHMVCSSIPVIGGDHLSEGHAIFGVMDGHGGGFTSEFAAQHFKILQTEAKS